MKFIAKITGEFEEKHEVEADSIEEAKEKFSSNLGNMIDSTAISELEVENITEVK